MGEDKRTVYIGDKPVVDYPPDYSPDAAEADRKNFDTLIRAAKANALILADAQTELDGVDLGHEILICAVNGDGSIVPLAKLIPAGHEVVMS